MKTRGDPDHPNRNPRPTNKRRKKRHKTFKPQKLSRVRLIHRRDLPRNLTPLQFPLDLLPPPHLHHFLPLQQLVTEP